jgi:type I pantothenate kinase
LGDAGTVKPSGTSEPEHTHQLFGRDDWRNLADATPLRLTDAQLDELRGLNDPVDLREVTEIYLPVSRLLNLHVTARQQLDRVSDTFLGTAPLPIPFVIGLAGSVAVGKSTTARVLRHLLAQWPEHRRVDLVTTDGFLKPNAQLEREDLLTKKGFPQSYRTDALIGFLQSIKSGTSPVSAPVYSHLTYDIVAGEELVVRSPDVLIVEGLNVLQRRDGGGAMASDYFDFTIYLDAPEPMVRQWYVERFLQLRQSAFASDHSYFRDLAHLGDDAATAKAVELWDTINGPNLRDNIAPTRDFADLVLTKGAQHGVESVLLRH